MTVHPIKSILPRGLYGRAALILIVPIITIQLVVSVVFIQRHFEGVTEQLTANIVNEIGYFSTRVRTAPDDAAIDVLITELSAPLGLAIRPMAPGEMRHGDIVPFDDLTGRGVVANLREGLPGIVMVDLASRGREVILTLDIEGRGFEVVFDRYRVSASNPHQLLVLMIGVSLLMTVISFMFLRNQVRPIRRLARAAEAFGKGQRIDYHVSGATEVRQAGKAFIDMRDRIERQIEQRTLMLSGVSHDLRTPLTRLKLGLSLIAADTETVALIRDVDDMEEMLEEFLAFARGDSLEQIEKTDPAALLQQLASDTSRSGDTIELVLPSEGPSPVLVAMRPNAVRRALDNLVTNALRYGSRCRIELAITDSDIVFTVEDDGPGIPPDQRRRAVRPFVRLDTARNQNRGTGVGLGLAIVMDIAGSHGGRLDLRDSVSLGGLRAELHLPR
ncbi:MAG: HAMP domain-containing protein [Rhodobacteraceae bacterium]|nr:HAMP domain-containing protein [Paracoccaceae bacterium]